MEIKYNINIKNDHIEQRIKKIINQVYKLLPLREEGEEWEKPLETIFEELKGMNSILDRNDIFFALLCKLEGLLFLNNDCDFALYRRTIFECLSLLNLIKNDYQGD